MKLDAHFYDLTQTLWSALFAAMTAVRGRSPDARPDPPPSPLLQLQAGMAESPGWFLVQAAEFDPEPLTVANLRVRDVYASSHMVQALLELMAAADWFDRRGEAYYLTEEGRSLIQGRQRSRDKWITALDPLVSVDIVRLESLLDRVIKACLSGEVPPGNWCLVHSHNRAPGAGAAISVKLFQHVVDINAFRDDCHMAAWRPHGIDGYVWEAFSWVASEKADDADGLFKGLAHRGYSREEYGAALHELAERGWLDPSAFPSYSVNRQGWTIHDSVEQSTDQRFYAPWRSTLSESEIAEAVDLVVHLREDLQRLA